MTTSEESGIYSPLHNEPVYKPLYEKEKGEKETCKETPQRGI